MLQKSDLTETLGELDARERECKGVRMCVRVRPRASASARVGEADAVQRLEIVNQTQNGAAKTNAREANNHEKRKSWKGNKQLQLLRKSFERLIRGNHAWSCRRGGRESSCRLPPPPAAKALL
eukprot:1503832-Pleurochrysis_carterae.AAC.1